MEIKGLRKIEPYVAGSQPAEKNIIKLNTNENAYGPSPAVHQALASFDAHQLRKYSTLDQTALRQALSDQLGVPTWTHCANKSFFFYTFSSFRY